MKITKNVFVILILIGFLFDIHSQIDWYQSNGPPGGIVLSQLTFQGRVYAATNSGIYYSSDFGDSWHLYGLVDEFISQLCVDSSGNVYAGILFGGLFRKYSYGNEWMPVMYGDTNYPTAISCHPQGTLFLGTYYGGLYRSNNAGNTWVEVNKEFRNKHILWILVSSNENIFVSIDSVGVFRSVDLGKNWEYKNSGINSHRINTIHEHADSSLLAGCLLSYPLLGGIYKSTNSGESWEYVTLDYANIYCFYSLQNNYIFAGTTNGFFRSTNGGTSWQITGNGLQSWDNQMSISFLNEKLFTGGFFGLYISSDLGQNFSTAPLICSYSITIEPRDNTLLAGTIDGVFRSTDYGENWSYYDNGINGHSTRKLYMANNGVGYASCDNYGLFKIKENSSYWEWVIQEYIHITDITESSNGEIFTVGHFWGTYRSTNSGSEWVHYSTPTNIDSLEAIRIDSKNRIFVGTRNHGVFMSSNDCVSWTAVNDSLYNKQINVMEIGLDGILYAGTKEGLFALDEVGNYWIDMNKNNLKLYISDILAISKDELLIATHGDGVYYTNVKNKDWIKTSDGLHSAFIEEISVDDVGHILLAVIGGGVYRSVSSVVTSQKTKMNQLPLNYSLYQNYPNPFNPTTTIKFQIPELSFVTLKIYDVLGNEISTIANEEKPEGTYEISWYPVNLTSGIYFYRLQVYPANGGAGDFVETKKMLLIK